MAYTYTNYQVNHIDRPDKKLRVEAFSPRGAALKSKRMLFRILNRELRKEPLKSFEVREV